MRQPHAHHLFGPRTGDIAAFKLNGTCGRAGNARDRIEQRCLSRSVRPENDDDLLLVDLQVDAVKTLTRPYPS